MTKKILIAHNVRGAGDRCRVLMDGRAQYDGPPLLVPLEVARLFALALVASEIELEYRELRDDEIEGLD
jgi:hypothetical protein